MTNFVQNLDFILGCVFLMAVLYCFNLLLIAYREYVNTKYKFRLYALRDELAMIVLRGEVDEGDDQFQCVNKAINYSIASVDHLSVHKVVKIIRSCIANNRKKNKSVQITNEDVRDIAIQYLEINREMLRKNTWFELSLVRLVLRHVPVLRRPEEAIQAINDAEGRLSAT